MEQILKDKISKAMNEEFVGNYIFTDEELTIIYDEVSYILKRVGSERGLELSCSDYELIFIALINLAKEWNHEENQFWEYINRRLLDKPSSGKIYNQLTNLMNKLHENKKIFMLTSYTKQYYATLCSHSFAPLSSIESFFEMSWDIYSKDLDYQYEKYDPVFEVITKSLNNKFSSYSTNEDDFQIGSKVYSLRVGVRGLTIDAPNLMTNLLDTTIETIHSLFFNEPLKMDKYIRVLINDWWKKKEPTFGIERARTHTRNEHTVTDYSQIKAKYILEEGVTKLVIPSIRLQDNFDYEPYIEIRINSERFVFENMITKGSGILMTTKTMEYELSKFSLGCIIDINIEITHCNKVIYNSKETLNREFILFKDSREILSQDCLPGIYFLYATDLDALLQYPSDIHANGLNAYSLESFDGEVIQSNKKTIFFTSEKSNRDLYFLAKEHNDALYHYGDKEYKIIDGELYVDINENIDVKDYGVRYEDSSFKLSEFKSEQIGNKIRYLISMLLSVGEPQHISIFKYSDNAILDSISLIKFNDIRISYDKDLYYGKDEQGKVSFLTEKYSIEKTFSISKNKIVIPFENGDIILHPPILRWKIDDNDWNTKPFDIGFWYKKITNSSILSIELPKMMNCIVALNNNQLEQSGKNLDYKLGQTIYALKENDSFSIDHFILFIKASNNEIYELAEIYYRESFLDEPLFIFSKLYQMFWQPQYYIGDIDSKFRLEIINSQGVVYSKELSTKKETINLTKIDENFYEYKIILLGKGLLAKEKELYSKDFVLGDEKNLKYKNKVLAIKQVMLFDKNKPETVKHIYIDNIYYLGERNNYDYYSGSIFIIRQDGRKEYLNSMKNEWNSYVKINPVRIEIRGDNSCYLGYGLDERDENFEYDDEFTLDDRGKTTIGQRSFGQKTRRIDYFLFEVRNNV